MSIWDKFKNVFAGKKAAAPTSPLYAKVEAAVLSRVRAGRSFVALDLYAEVLGDAMSIEGIQETNRALEEVVRSGVVQKAGFARDDRGVFHPEGSDPTGFVQSSPMELMAPQAAAGAPSPGRDVPLGRTLEDFSNPALFGFSDEELKQRATRVDPLHVGWIGPTSEIPPETDARTAAIDRGLVMRGLLSEAQIAEVHATAKRWGLHRDADWTARALAARTADEAVQRLREERARRREERQRIAAEREAQRSSDVARRRAEDIIHLGAGVSSGLADRRANPELLQKHGLPALSTPADVARALGLTIPRLRWLAFHTQAAERPHYVYFEVPKRSGGTRLLSAPHADLGKAQRWILENILEKLPTEACAHGFVKGRSTVTNARPHLARDLVVNLDLQDFFPSVTFPRVRGIFSRLGYSPAAATVLALLCTESPRRKVEYDGAAYWVAVGPRALPQGACTSPALSNQVARKLDRRLTGMARRHGWTYTRYADDLTFSCAKGNEGEVAMLLARVRHVVGEEGFALQLKKGRVQRASGRQSVTGIVVNDRLSLPRDELRALRALLHNARKTGLAAQNREQRPNFEAWLRGKIAYVTMVDRQKGLALLKQLDALAGAGRGVA